MQRHWLVGGSLASQLLCWDARAASGRLFCCCTSSADLYPASSAQPAPSGDPAGACAQCTVLLSCAQQPASITAPHFFPACWLFCWPLPTPLQDLPPPPPEDLWEPAEIDRVDRLEDQQPVGVAGGSNVSCCITAEVRMSLFCTARE